MSEKKVVEFKGSVILTKKDLEQIEEHWGVPVFRQINGRWYALWPKFFCIKAAIRTKIPFRNGIIKPCHLANPELLKDHILKVFEPTQTMHNWGKVFIKTTEQAMKEYNDTLNWGGTAEGIFSGAFAHLLRGVW